MKAGHYPSDAWRAALPTNSPGRPGAKAAGSGLITSTAGKGLLASPKPRPARPSRRISKMSLAKLVSKKSGRRESLEDGKATEYGIGSLTLLLDFCHLDLSLVHVIKEVNLQQSICGQRSKSDPISVANPCRGVKALMGAF